MRSHGSEVDLLYVFHAETDDEGWRRFNDAFDQFDFRARIERVPISLPLDAAHPGYLDAVVLFLEEMRKHLPANPFRLIAPVGLLRLESAITYLTANSAVRIGVLKPLRIPGGASLPFGNRIEVETVPVDGDDDAYAVEEPVAAPLDLREPDRHLIDDLAAHFGCVGDHPRFRRQLESAQTLAPLGHPILLHGEIGSGRRRFAELIHQLSGRSPSRFVALTCSSVSPTLIESVCFGYHKGAIAGSSRRYTGKFEQADGGTLYLNGIDSLPLRIQDALVSVIDEGYIRPLGAGSARRVDVRIIASTTRELNREALEGTFSSALLRRLEPGTIDIMPLRERSSDIPRIALEIVDRLNREGAGAKTIAPEALRLLQSREWPGNLLDLRQVLVRAYMAANTPVISVEDIAMSEEVGSMGIGGTGLPHLYPGFSLERFLSNLRRRLINKALNLADMNQSEAARLLGISPQAVHKFVKLRQREEQENENDRRLDL